MGDEGPKGSHGVRPAAPSAARNASLFLFMPSRTREPDKTDVSPHEHEGAPVVCPPHTWTRPPIHA